MADVISMEPIVAAVFDNEDTLDAFIKELDAKQRGALYELLYGFGCRYTGRAIEDWGRAR